MKQLEVPLFSEKYIRTGPQTEFKKACEHYRFPLFIGGVRSGKTVGGAHETERKAMKWKKGKGCGMGWIVSPTFPMSIVPEGAFLRYINPLLIRDRKVSERTIELVNGFKVQVKTAEKPDHLRGPELDWIWVDEISMISEECFDILLGRILSTKGSIIGTTTPRGKNWLYRRWYTEATKDKRTPEGFRVKNEYCVVNAPIDSNTYLDPLEIHALREAYDPRFAAQELDAQFVSFEGLVYDLQDKHLWKKPIPQFDEAIAGIDWGYGDPFVIEALGRVGRRWINFDEFYATKQDFDSLVDHITLFQRKNNISVFYADPSGSEWIYSCQKRGLNVVPASFRDLMLGIQRVAGLMNTNELDGLPLLMVCAETCPHSVVEFGEYHFADEDKRLSSSNNTPVDKYNHTHDARRYAITSHLPRQAAAIPLGEGIEVTDAQRAYREMIMREKQGQRKNQYAEILGL